MNKNINKIAIIGAGASGLFSSILLSKKNHDVTIYEKNNKVGKKLLATGNGRCNISNENINLNHFHSNSDISYLKNIFKSFNYQKTKQFFSDIGIEFVNGANGRVYPMSLMASSVTDILEYEALKLGVKIQLNHDVQSLSYSNNKFIIDGKDTFDKVIIATGSLAMPKLGSCDSGYKFAQKFKHTIIPPFASLVQLVSSNKNIDSISGVKIEAKVNGVVGDVLFTKYGLSGSAILDVSRKVSQKLQTQKNIQVSVDTMPHFPKEKLISLLNDRAIKLGEKEIFLWLDGIMNKKLSRYIIINSKISNSIKYAKFLNKKDILKIVHTIKNLEFNIIDTKGYETCEVCAGGVELNQINLATMESKLQKNLYFLGEVLDIDGDCGGYNLQWAWSSSYNLANNI